MGIGLGLMAGGFTKGVEQAEDIRTKRSQRDAQDMQNQLTQAKLDSDARADAIARATYAPGAAVPEGYDQQAAIAAANKGVDDTIAARKAQENMGPIQRLAAAFHPAARDATAAAAGIGPPRPGVGLVPGTLASGVPIPLQTAPTALGLAAPPDASAPPAPPPTAPMTGPGALPALPGQPPGPAAATTPPAAPPAPAAAPPVAAGGPPPVPPPPIAQQTAALSSIPPDAHASETVKATVPGAPQPAPGAPGSDNTLAHKAQLQTEENAWLAQAQILHAKKDYAGAMDAYTKASAAHTNGVIKDLVFASPMQMSRVLTEATGSPRTVQEANGKYAVFDDKGQVLEHFNSKDEMMAAVKTRMDSDPTIGMNLKLQLQKEAREQTTADANVKRVAAEIDYLGTQGKALTAKTAIEQGEFGMKSKDWQDLNDATNFIKDPANRLRDPAKWDAYAQVLSWAHPDIATSTQIANADGTVTRIPTNRVTMAGNDVATAFNNDPLVKGPTPRVQVGHAGDKTYFVMRDHQGNVHNYTTPEEALFQGRKEWPELYQQQPGAGAAKGGTGGKSVRGVGLGGSGRGGPRAAPAAAAPEAPAGPAPNMFTTLGVQTKSPAPTSLTGAGNYITAGQYGDPKKYVDDPSNRSQYKTDTDIVNSKSTTIPPAQKAAAQRRKELFERMQVQAISGSPVAAGR